MLASEWGRRAVITSIVSSVATSYFQLREYDAALQIAQDTLASRQKSLKLTTVLANNGSASAVELKEAEQLVYSAAETIPDLQRQIAQQENTLSHLTGSEPGQYL